MGFRQITVLVLAIKLARHRPEIPIRVNIGKTKENMTATRSAAALHNRRPDGRPRWRRIWWSTSALQHRGYAICRRSNRSGPSLSAVRAELTPVLVKIAPDLSDSDLDLTSDLVVELDLAGIVAANTTMSRDGWPPGGRRIWVPAALRATAGSTRGPGADDTRPGR